MFQIECEIVFQLFRTYHYLAVFLNFVMQSACEYVYMSINYSIWLWNRINFNAPGCAMQTACQYEKYNAALLHCIHCMVGYQWRRFLATCVVSAVSDWIMWGRKHVNTTTHISIVHNISENMFFTTFLLMVADAALTDFKPSATHVLSSHWQVLCLNMSIIHWIDLWHCLQHVIWWRTNNCSPHLLCFSCNACCVSIWKFWLAVTPGTVLLSCWLTDELH